MVEEMAPRPSFTVGVLALQGAFGKHEEALHRLNVTTIQVRTPQDLQLCDGLIIPGGESSTMFRQLDFIHLIEPLKEFARRKPIFGTCAGLILMSKAIVNSPFIPLGILNVIVERNSYGRQIDSFFTVVSLPTFSKATEAFFIRAPKIKQYGEEVQILAKYQDEPVLVQQGFHLGATFHAELTTSTILHEHFLSLIAHSKK